MNLEFCHGYSSPTVQLCYLLRVESTINITGLIEIQKPSWKFLVDFVMMRNKDKCIRASLHWVRVGNTSESVIYRMYLVSSLLENLILISVFKSGKIRRRTLFIEEMYRVSFSSILQIQSYTTESRVQSAKRRLTRQKISCSIGKVFQAFVMF